MPASRWGFGYLSAQWSETSVRRGSTWRQSLGVNLLAVIVNTGVAYPRMHPLVPRQIRSTFGWSRKPAGNVGVLLYFRYHTPPSLGSSPRFSPMPSLPSQYFTFTSRRCSIGLPSTRPSNVNTLIRVTASWLEGPKCVAIPQRGQKG